MDQTLKHCLDEAEKEITSIENTTQLDCRNLKAVFRQIITKMEEITQGIQAVQTIKAIAYVSAGFLVVLVSIIIGLLFK